MTGLAFRVRVARAATRLRQKWTPVQLSLWLGRLQIGGTKGTVAINHRTSSRPLRMSTSAGTASQISGFFDFLKDLGYQPPGINRMNWRHRYIIHPVRPEL